ncbi:MAG TPA: DUF1844 domain-containing protein [Elusimicrobia bacterium]|nr:MAG: hypothetical protein A2278_08655 [Elusimicrobia bacterium RIFOXYA12_FULL_49_49]OGS09639.1 MAG: hypothetical protein A2204_04080 [Elusimicrobia bacterium RIFOXYA1_FULL_47_7]OGS10745.1 MAG: hypothetical protein A2386_01750 [Elusimicrobia bacterium RIFOXYB1_FULL_48_9]OGS14802.1 MAG: hypothetical protein A2251_09940 [Elusimicrobia bacterium RIFOXYA2_FULL_47_53]OGS25548.1 MAG: hypothetical protein A2339_05655 [Elusimicrobia bacterium RIFOXYB12_FULL_50_12]OGS28914.1 MAG: hypothetical protein
MEESKNINQQFLSLVLMLASACWQQLGKIPNPATGKSELALDHANVTLEILLMLKEKTKANLSAEEEKLLSNTIADLELNYADEVNKVKTDNQPKN